MTREALYLEACILAVERYIDDGSSHFGKKEDGKVFTARWEDIRDWLIEQYASAHRSTGRWYSLWKPGPHKIYFFCSDCERNIVFNDDDYEKIRDYKYCPFCGKRKELLDEKSIIR